MKIKFDLDDYLPLNKTIEIHNVTIVVGVNFYENNKYYPQIFLDEYLYQLYIIKKSYIMIELTFLKELTLIRQMNQKSAIFVTTSIF